MVYRLRKMNYGGFRGGGSGSILMAGIALSHPCILENVLLADNCNHNTWLIHPQLSVDIDKICYLPK